VRNQEEVRLACHDTSVIDLETHEHYMHRLEKDPTVHQWIITCDGIDVGHAKIIGQEFGYMIRDGFRGQGIGVRFHELIFQEAIRLGIPKLRDTIKIGNRASLNLALKTGFVYTGTVRADNQPYAYTLEKAIG
jgi:RimJ/RimL family protein N-acetyltransferase